MRTDITAIKTEQSEIRGAAKEAAAKSVRTVQMLAGLAALSTVATFVLSHWPRR